jgi:hypothetical protein
MPELFSDVFMYNRMFANMGNWVFANINEIAKII